MAPNVHWLWPSYEAAVARAFSEFQGPVSKYNLTREYIDSYHRGPILIQTILCHRDMWWHWVFMHQRESMWKHVYSHTAHAIIPPEFPVDFELSFILNRFTDNLVKIICQRNRWGDGLSYLPVHRCFPFVGLRCNHYFHIWPSSEPKIL